MQRRVNRAPLKQLSNLDDDIYVALGTYIDRRPLQPAVLPLVHLCALSCEALPSIK